MVRRGAGLRGSDRVTITWDDAAVKNAWLQVTVLANQRTGVPADDVFCFGNLVGETGDAASWRTVGTPTSYASARNSRCAPLQPPTPSTSTATAG